MHWTGYRHQQKYIYNVEGWETFLAEFCERLQYKCSNQILDIKEPSFHHTCISQQINFSQGRRRRVRLAEVAGPQASRSSVVNV